MTRIDENIHRALKDYGLTEYEIKAYLKLVSNGPATPYEISEAAGIPYARVYGTLEGLEKRGWIETQPGRPVIYRAKPPRSVAELAIERSKSFMDGFVSIMVRDLQSIYAKRETVKHIGLWVINGGDKILDKHEEMISRARSHIYFITSTLMFKEADALRKAIADAQTRGVDTKTVFFSNPKYVEEEAIGLLARLSDVGVIDEVEQAAKPFNTVVVDGRDVLLTFLWNLEVPSDVGSKIAFRITDEDLAGVLERYCEHYWIKARKSYRSEKIT